MKTKSLLSLYFSAWTQKYDHLISLYTAQLYCVLYLEIVISNFHLWLVLLLFFTIFLVPYISKLFELYFSMLFRLLHKISPKKIEQKTQKVEREFRCSPPVMLSSSVVYILILSMLNVFEEKNESMIIGIGFLVLSPLNVLIHLVYVIIEIYYREYKLEKSLKWYLKNGAENCSRSFFVLFFYATLLQ